VGANVAPKRAQAFWFFFSKKNFFLPHTLLNSPNSNARARAKISAGISPSLITTAG
jgi:hypothetical protein